MSDIQESISTQPSVIQSLLCISGILFFVFFGLLVLKTSLHSIILLSLLWVILHAFYLDQDQARLKQGMSSAIQKSAPVFLYFILIGAVIAAFTMSGAIPTLIYYGLNFISPQNFLPIGMILCSMMSLAIGSCWGTIGTIGVALMGVASILHIPAPMAAGMIVSGAYFGDKFSPISDTTILSALATDTDLYTHIKGMTYSIIPAYLISFCVFWFIGKHYVVDNPAYLQDIASIQQLIGTHVHIGFMTLLPIFAMLALSLKKKPAELSMLVSIVIALGISFFMQHLTLIEVLNSLFSGPHFSRTGSIILDTALSRGGIQSMLWSMSLALLILALGGLLDNYQFISTLFARMIYRLKHPVSLVLATLSIATTCNLLMGEAYLSIILTSQLFKQAYQKMGLESCVLSKAIEEGSTFSTPLIPWTTSGAFISATLGVYPLDYLFWSVFNWVAPIVFLGFVAINFVGIKMYVQDPVATII